VAVIMTVGGEALVVEGEATEVLEQLRGADGFMEISTMDGTVHLNPASVAYVKDGDVVDPIRDTAGPQD
jgi:hypothetical protein